MEEKNSQQPDSETEGSRDTKSSPPEFPPEPLIPPGQAEVYMYGIRVRWPGATPQEMRAALAAAIRRAEEIGRI